MFDNKIWLWLSLHFGAGTALYKKLYSHFGSVDAIYDCVDADVDCIDWLAPHQRRKLLDKNMDHAEEILEWCDYYGVKIVTPSDIDYPLPLRALDNFPAVLYYRGNLPDFEKVLCISVVGTRSLTMEGQRNAYNLGYGLAKGGALVISGMAKGIDCVAQKGALYAGGSSVAVLGCGIDVVYPRENLALMEKIARVGAVLTEYPPHTPPSGHNFPVRNRLISGLSKATVVVEADMNSGALITARLAREQGRELFAFPGSVNNFTSKGTNHLLSEGARVATAAIDVLEQFMDIYPALDLSASKQRPDLSNRNKVAQTVEIPADFYSNLKNNNSKHNTKAIAHNVKEQAFDASLLDERERLVYDAMEYGKTITLEGFMDVEIDISELVSIMTMLEIKGAVESVPGGFYIKK